MYNRHTTDKQSAETAEASLSGEQSGTTPSTSMNAPTSSADKVTDISETSKGNEGKDVAKKKSGKTGVKVNVVENFFPINNSTPQGQQVSLRGAFFAGRQ